MTLRPPRQRWNQCRLSARRSFVATQKILGAVSPELFGDNNALFAVTLSEDGASILEQAFEDGMAPVGGIYNLKFTGVRPALDVKITADLKRVFDAFSIGLEAKVYWVSAGIDATFEKLKQDGAIKVEVVNLTTDSVDADKEQWALNLFKDQILSTWFEPSLSPTGAATGTAPTTTPTKGGGTQPVKPSPPAGGTGTLTSPGGMHAAEATHRWHYDAGWYAAAEADTRCAVTDRYGRAQLLPLPSPHPPQLLRLRRHLVLPLLLREESRANRLQVG